MTNGQKTKAIEAFRAWLARHEGRQSWRSLSDATPDPAGGFCGICGVDAWTHGSYKCPGCGAQVPPAKR